MSLTPHVTFLAGVSFFTLARWQHAGTLYDRLSTIPKEHEGLLIFHSNSCIGVVHNNNHVERQASIGTTCPIFPITRLIRFIVSTENISRYASFIFNNFFWMIFIYPVLNCKNVNLHLTFVFCSKGDSESLCSSGSQS